MKAKQWQNMGMISMRRYSKVPSVRLYPSNNNQLDFQKSPSSARDDFVARGRPLRGQTRLVPLAKRSTCSKSNNQPADDQRAEVAEYHENIKIFILKRDNTKVSKKYSPIHTN